MVFTREPVVAPGTPALTFDSKIIPAAEFQEHNGEAELIVSGTVPLMASFSNDGRTITISPPQAVTAQTQPQATAPAQGVIGLPSAPSGPLAGTPRYVAVIDAAHGGDERGAALTEQIAEKDVTLAFARRLRQELDSRNLATLLVRDSDITLTADQRATTVNGTDPAIYISVHAAAQGNGVRLYTALLASGGENHGPLIDWDTAQASFQAISQAAATSVGAELRSKQVPVRTLVAPLRPLNNIITASIALEIAPPAGDITQLNAPAYQQLIAGAVAAGVADIRDQLEAGRK